ncbi:MAG: hypothetical protein SH868_11235 [Bythopirellula sp.]|nr:hypothetical protein [Bythopirellula sp.]
MSTKKQSLTPESPVTAQCRQIRRSWTASERRLREMRANVAQSRLALSILFREFNGCAK